MYPNFSVFEVSPAWNYIFSDVYHLCKKWIKAYFKVKLASVVLDIYWAKVLPEQWEWNQIFRKHEIFRKKKNKNAF